jgi:hypothetical protein
MRSYLLSFVAVLVALAPARVLAEQVTLTFSGTVSNAFGDLGSVLAANDTFTGRIVYESTTAGVFTPSPNPTFVRSGMLYSGAIVSAEFSIIGDTSTGTGGDFEIQDATEMLAGQDELRITGSLDSGTIGGVALASVFLNPFYDYLSYTVSAGDPVPQPLGFAEAAFFGFNLSSAGGGSANGPITSFDVAIGGTPVPAQSPPSAALLIVLLGAAAILALRRTGSSECR